MTKRILVIDDDHLVVKSLARLLEGEGYLVTIAESGQKAIDFVKQIDFNLIVADIRMPGINGIETTGNIKDILKKKNKEITPIIFITGYSDEHNYNEAKKLNPADFIYKPFDKDKFLESIKNVLGG